MSRSDAQPTTMRARTPEDLLAMVPVLLGFTPEESVTLLTLGDGRRMHARVDLPEALDEVPMMVRALMQPCVRHRVERVALVFFAASPELSGICAQALGEALSEAGIEVVEVVRADGDRWFALDGRGWAPGVPYDVSAHPFVVQAVLRGEVVFTTRQALDASLDPDSARVASVQKLLDREDPDVPVRDGWIRELLADCAREDRPPLDGEIAHLLRALAQTPVRDAAWEAMSRDQAPEHVRFWTAVLVASPAGLRTAPAGLLAFAAWLAGHGALAWCAVDRVDSDAGDQKIGELVRSLLEHAVPPSAWDRGPTEFDG